MSTTFGAQSTWRQLVDLVGRGRAGPRSSEDAIQRLRMIRADVPPPVRAASARALAFATPPAALVALFAEDEIAVASPVLRAVSLRADEWTALLPAMSPSGRSILRHRRDLPPAVVRALESFGSVDFVLGGPPPVEAESLDLAVEREAEPAADPIVLDSIEVSAEVLEPVVVAVEAEADAAPAEPTEIDWTDVVGDAEMTMLAHAEPPAEPEPELEVQPAAEAEPELEVQPEADAAPEPDPVVQPDSEAEPNLLIAPPVEPQPEREAGPEMAGEGAQPAAPEPEPEPEIVAEPVAIDVPAFAPAVAEPALHDAPTIAPVSPFVSIAAGLPVVAEARRQAEARTAQAIPATVIRLPELDPQPAQIQPRVAEIVESGPFEISELVARIDAFQRKREAGPIVSPEIQSELFDHEPMQAQAFRFETDAAGVIRWIEGAARAPLIGLSLDLAALPSAARVDGVAAGAFRRRAGFANARLVVDGRSDAAGQWRITGIPVFDRATGRFTGYRGTARRPRPDESAEPVREERNPAADALRQLVHELRTPTNAIAGFAEMIESQMLGPVPAAYRAHAAAIRGQASGLLGAIDDIDMAARIETQALDFRADDVPVAPLLARICDDLASLAALRGATIDHYVGSEGMAIRGDDRAVERLIARIMATLVAATRAGERVGISATIEEGVVSMMFDRPAALAAYSEDALLTIDAEAEAERGAGGEGAPLLGTGFALRLARNLAAELRGSLTIGAGSLTLRLPAAEAATMEQASSN